MMRVITSISALHAASDALRYAQTCARAAAPLIDRADATRHDAYATPLLNIALRRVTSPISPRQRHRHIDFRHAAIAFRHARCLLALLREAKRKDAVFSAPPICFERAADMIGAFIFFTTSLSSLRASLLIYRWRAALSRFLQARCAMLMVVLPALIAPLFSICRHADTFIAISSPSEQRVFRLHATRLLLLMPLLDDFTRATLLRDADYAFSRAVMLLRGKARRDALLISTIFVIFIFLSSSRHAAAARRDATLMLSCADAPRGYHFLRFLRFHLSPAAILRRHYRHYFIDLLRYWFRRAAILMPLRCRRRYADAG